MKEIGNIALVITTVAMLVTAAPKAQAATAPSIFNVSHDAQGTGNYKGKRDRHEKPGPLNEKKRKRFGWIPKR